MAEIPESSGPDHQNLQNLPEAALRGGFDGFVGWLSGWSGR
jgi:hypothetical protein